MQRAYETDDLDEQEVFEQSANDVKKQPKNYPAGLTDIEGIDTAEMIFMFLPNDNIYANAVNKKENLLEQCYKGFPVGKQSNKTPIILVALGSLTSSLKVSINDVERKESLQKYLRCKKILKNCIKGL